LSLFSGEGGREGGREERGGRGEGGGGSGRGDKIPGQPAGWPSTKPASHSRIQ